ncbi:MAG TPA: ABC transporter ATP-binding protein [Chitinophagaceae bacterium]|nr:ABC transporter ATP-binding protein [Chitinophagaceae bacterium]
MAKPLSPAARLWNLVQEEKSEITAIYFFAILGGLIQLTLPVGIQTIIGFVLGGTLSASLMVLITILVLAVLFTGIIQVNQMKVIEKIQQRIFVRYSFAFADRIPKLDLKKVDGFYLPELVNRFFDTVSLQKGFAKLLLDLPLAIIQIFFGLTLLSFYHPFFILFGLLILVLLWLILRTTGNKGLQSSLAESSYKYALVGWFEEMARLVKSFKFSNADLHLIKADEKTGNYLQARTEHFKVLEFQFKVIVAFKVLITAAMLVGGVVLLLNQQINIGQFVAAEIIIITIIASIEKIITNLDSVYDVMTAVEKISKLIDKPLEKGGNYQLESSLPIAISAEGLRFAYDKKPVVADLNFSINPGEKVCIKGRAGVGKSTMLRLLTGVYKDFEGHLLINKIPIANYDLASLRERMGILFQHENIFHGTLWENLTMGKPGTDKVLINDLCERTGLQSFLSNQPNGYDTELDPTGKRLPRSVVQKILLVRALAHKPSLLIMEEPWQGIEEEYRHSIQELILNASNTTVIVATTDESFSEKCNQIIHLEIQKSAA